MKKIKSTLIISLLAFLAVIFYSSAIYASDIPEEEIENYTKPVINSINITSNNIKMNWEECDYANYYYITYKIGKNISNSVTTKYNSLLINDISVLNGSKITIEILAVNEIYGITVPNSYTTYYYEPINITKLYSPSSKKITIEWNQNKKISDYEIRYTFGNKVKTIKVHNKNKYTLTLEGNKKYSFRIRGYKKNNDEIDYTTWSESKSIKTKYNKWDKLLDTYATDDKTNQLVFVKYKSGSSAKIEFYEKVNGKFKLVLSENGYVGRNGINKEKEGDMKTPTGTFNLTTAFGIKDNPGTKIKYTKVNKNLWWCSDKNYYNQLIDIKKNPHNCKGEHLINYGGAYNYCLFIDYNKEGVYPKGSAIFLHCRKTAKSTAGCVALSENGMKTIIKKVDKGAKICIYKE